MDDRLIRRGLAELVGTALLLGAAIGGGRAATSNGASAPLALLIGTLAAGATLFVVLHGIGPITGGHVNPAVTISMLTTGNIAPIAAAVYIVAQVIGGLIGAAAANGLWDTPLVAGPGAGTLTGPMYLAEVVATAGLVGGIHAGVLGGNAGRLPMIVPAAVMAGSFAAPFGMANPAVAFGSGVIGGGISLGSILGLVAIEMAVGSVIGLVVAQVYRGFGEETGETQNRCYQIELGDLGSDERRVATGAIQASIRPDDCLVTTPEGLLRVVFTNADDTTVESARHRIEATVQLALLGSQHETGPVRVGLRPLAGV